MVDSRTETEKKCKMNPVFLFGPESRGLLKRIRGYVKKHRDQLEGFPLHIYVYVYI